MEQDLKRLNDSTSELWESGRDQRELLRPPLKGAFQLEKIWFAQQPMKKLYDHATVPSHPFLSISYLCPGYFETSSISVMISVYW